MALTERPRNSLRTRFNAISAVSFIAVTGLVLLLLVARGHKFLVGLTVGVGLAGVAQALAWGVSEIVAPGWVIRWREALIKDNFDWARPVGQAFSNRLGIHGDAPWADEEARRRTRRLGIILSLLAIGFAAILILAVGPLDTLFTSMLRAPN